LPKEPQNAALHLFSASPELVKFRQETYRQHSPDTSTVLRNLFNLQGQGVGMSYTMQDFLRDYFKKHFPKLTAQERRDVLESLAPEERRQVLESLPPRDLRDVLGGLSPRKRREVLTALPTEEQEAALQELPLERRLAGVSEEQLRQYLDRMAAGQAARPRKPRRRK
jgi:hypothetical protein